jgi:transglutaminase-like putative cysteine protease
VRYHIVHTTTYTYDRPVTLEPHVLRLRPRCDGFQTLRHFSLAINPEPTGVSQVIDPEGNVVVRMWFREPTDCLSFKVVSEVETYCTNPFNYFLEPWAVRLPIDYPASILTQLQPYLQRYGIPTTIDPGVVQLAEEVYQGINGETLTFLSELNQRIYQTCQYRVRATGDPLPAGITWTHKSGSCRDLAVLFIETCRVVGLAARFVSGYQEGDLNQKQRDLHAWAEVYLPGAGWRGYDPTQGLAVADRHVVLVASALSRYAAPISGSLRGQGSLLKMQAHLSIHPLVES